MFRSGFTEAVDEVLIAAGERCEHLDHPGLKSPLVVPVWKVREAYINSGIASKIPQTKLTAAVGLIIFLPGLSRRYLGQDPTISLLFSREGENGPFQKHKLLLTSNPYPELNILVRRGFLGAVFGHFSWDDCVIPSVEFLSAIRGLIQHSLEESRGVH